MGGSNTKVSAEPILRRQLDPRKQQVTPKKNEVAYIVLYVVIAVVVIAFLLITLKIYLDNRKKAKQEEARRNRRQLHRRSVLSSLGEAKNKSSLSPESEIGDVASNSTQSSRTQLIQSASTLKLPISEQQVQPPRYTGPPSTAPTDSYVDLYPGNSFETGGGGEFTHFNVHHQRPQPRHGSLASSTGLPTAPESHNGERSHKISREESFDFEAFKVPEEDRIPINREKLRSAMDQKHVRNSYRLTHVSDSIFQGSLDDDEQQDHDHNDQGQVGTTGSRVEDLGPVERAESGSTKVYEGQQTLPYGKNKD